MSSEWSSFPVSACFDSNPNSFCHSHSNGPLTITMTGIGAIFDTIKVTNRLDAPDRIVGGSISININSVVVWSSIFGTQLNYYTFTFTAVPGTPSSY